jgi:hypothetical protein
MLAARPGQIIRELSRLRLGDSRLVAANRSEPGSRDEIKSRKGMRGWMLADVYPGQVKLRERVRARDGKADARGALVNPKRNSFTNRGVMTHVCETSKLRL